ncbi:MAG: hypothetical protein IPF46_17580 [Saprospiraceae bacterium]|nr:hypothetical protein [Candidatus Vicinibacter affinis]
MAGIRPDKVLPRSEKVDSCARSQGLFAWFYLLLFLSVYFFSYGCKNKNKISTLEQDSRLLATLYCEAKQLKEERFLLADHIRFSEDSLMQFPEKNKYFLSRLDSLNKLIEPLHEQTKNKSEQIKLLQQKLYDSIYTSKKDRIILDQEFLKVSNQLCSDK